ncbi:uncharacterized protein BT62DRAFT_889155 [Guyanagaster necrorhizus]|uniref:Tail specific protease domain-containing protein n=1 Tax=Guyanagaster necrorhizus TaxID=856835 RepID=A0A9P7VWG2_9AGAR|nr:uncharacterized protein BT62DRAFT_889155 [Guyanagaster necrorhizus MCA 3950]KAG7448573.1 hypothetical protein BT62DRAFT_889155 [Guyanagaster necrorhizus MCA 3950]
MRFLVPAVVLVAVVSAQNDHCAVISGQTWVTPAQVRECYRSFAVNETEKANIIEVINKTLSFHTSVSYEVQAPWPYSDTHEDILADLARISSQTYASDYDLHVDLSLTVKRLHDGHCVWVNYCYDSAFVNYLPIPLVLLNGTDVHIALEAYNVSSVEFAEVIPVWERALIGTLDSGLQKLNGAKVLKIDDQDPFSAVNANADIAGGFQAYGTRQNGFFSSYQRSTASWSYVLGNFAQQSLPLSDSVELSVQLVNGTTANVVLPYLSRISSSTVNFTSADTYRSGNCLAVVGTNGVNYYESTLSSTLADPLVKAQQVPGQAVERSRALNIMLDSAPASDIALPTQLQPVNPVVGFGEGQFYLLDDGVTGVLALGSFSGNSYDVMMQGLLDGLVELRSRGAQRLVVDLTNNGGGYICGAHFLHRIIIGPTSTTEPQAGLNTTARDPELARQVVQTIVDSSGTVDPNTILLYNPLGWHDIHNEQFNITDNWLVPPVAKVINRRSDAFSQTLGSECPPAEYTTPPPDEGLFDGSQVLIHSGDRCASSCSLFSVTMAKLEGSKTVVVGGKNDVDQKFCGVVGGQSTDFSTIDSEIKTTGLKSNSRAPPDLLVNGVQGITWRLGYGIWNPSEPEEWQDRPADYNLPLTLDLANNPTKIWDKVASLVF